MKTVALKGLAVSYWRGTTKLKGFAKTRLGARRIAGRNSGNSYGPHVEPVFAEPRSGIYEVDLDGFAGGQPSLLGQLPDGTRIELFRGVA